jgi:L-threonylcarbamoyladenylate synthase
VATIGVNIEEAKESLLQGKLVGIPTETVYGLGGNALDEKVVLSIFQAKNRPSFDPLIIHTDRLDKLKNFVHEIPTPLLCLANRFWPGPLTILLPKKSIIPDLVTSGLDQVAVRIPDNPLTLALLSKLDFPLAAPSANPFGYISPTTAQHVENQLGEQVSYILDGGACEIGIESTIVGMEAGELVIYRLGGLSIEDIESVVGKVKIMSHSSSNPKAPGMIKSHYAPKKRFLLHDRVEFGKVSGSIGYLLFDQYLDGVDTQYQRLLSPTGDLKEAAQNLFKYLRELDNLAIDLIEAEFVPNVDLGRAINDRLRRAAAQG